ncbi:MAG: (Fe-S)-binding protein [Candidatus Pacearchaeota archaeon]
MTILSFLQRMGKNNLYYPGCMLKFGMNKELENYKEILNLLGIDFVLIKEEQCCGSPVLNAGYVKDFKDLIKKNYEIFKQRRVYRIITPCPGCYNIFKNEAKKHFIKWDIEVEHIISVILRELKKRKQKRELKKMIVSYHDPCHLGRFCKIYEEPRELITLLKGEIKEMIHNRENAICCGAGGGMRANFPEIAKEIAKKRVQEVPKEAEKILTPCGLCTMNLKTADERVEELSNWILERIKIGYF